jgi:hypothetical protein
MAKPNNQPNKIADAISLATITQVDEGESDATLYTTCVVYTVLIDQRLKHPLQEKDTTWQLIGEINSENDPRFYFICSNMSAANAKELRVCNNVYTLFLERKVSLPEIGMCIYEPSQKNHPKLIMKAINEITIKQAWIDRTMLAIDMGKIQLIHRYSDDFKYVPIAPNKISCNLTTICNSTAPVLYHIVVDVPGDSEYCSLDSATVLSNKQVFGFGVMIVNDKLYCAMAISVFYCLERLYNNNGSWSGLVSFPLMLNETNNPVCTNDNTDFLPTHISLIDTETDNAVKLLKSDKVLKIGDHDVIRGNIIVQPLGKFPIVAAMAHLYVPGTQIIITIKRGGGLLILSVELETMHSGRRMNWSLLSQTLPKDINTHDLRFSQMTEERYNVIEALWRFTKGYVNEILKNNYGKKTRPIFILLPCRYDDIEPNIIGKPFHNDGTGYVLWKIDNKILSKTIDFKETIDLLKIDAVSKIELRGANKNKLVLEYANNSWLVSSIT